MVEEEEPDPDMAMSRNDDGSEWMDCLKLRLESATMTKTEANPDESDRNSPYMDYHIYTLRSDDSWEPIEMEEEKQPSTTRSLERGGSQRRNFSRRSTNWLGEGGTTTAIV